MIAEVPVAGGPAAAPERVERWGRGLIAALLASALAGTLALAAVDPWYGLALPAAAVAAAAMVFLGRYPLGHLLGVFALFAFTASYKAGVQVEEVVFAGYYLLFLVHWFVSRMMRGEPIVRTATDAAVMFFLVYMTGSLGLTLFFGGDLSIARSEWINFSMLAFYFPVKEACERHRYGPAALTGVLLFWGAFAFVQNIILLKGAMSNAAYAWQIARGRVPMNEILLLAASLLSITLAVHARRKDTRLALVAGFAAFTLGLILTQWRAYYVDLVLGLFVLFLLGNWKTRARVGGYSLVAGLAGAALAYAVLGDTIGLIALGLLDRLLSIGTATTADISLLNRWFETEAAWSLVRVNPIVGYGLGTEFGFFDATSKSTWVKAYVHNGYLMLWFKFGILGLASILIVWGRSILTALSTLRDRKRAGDAYPLALFTFVTLIALVPSHFTSATFSTGDTVLTFGVLTGIAAGLFERASRPSGGALQAS